MRHIVKTLRTQWLGALGLVVGLTGVAFGATGQPAILGRLNQASKPTIFENTGSGSAVAFQTKTTQPPFTVTSGKQVPNLNAAKLGGRPASAFASAGSVYTKSESDGKYAAAKSTYTKNEVDLGFVPKGALANYYTRSAIDVTFAPATGSPNYLSPGYRVLATFGTGAPIFEGASTALLSPRGFTAPTDGTIFISLIGTCYGLNAGNGGSVSVQAGSGPVTHAFVNTLDLCDVTDSAPVAQGSYVEVQASLSATSGTAVLDRWSGTVYFVPD